MVEVRFGGIFADLFIAAASAILVVPVRQVGWACMHDALAFALLNEKSGVGDTQLAVVRVHSQLQVFVLKKGLSLGQTVV